MNNRIDPTCPANFNLNKDECICVKSIPPTKDCPPGKEYYAPTKRCRKIKNLKIVEEKTKKNTPPKKTLLSNKTLKEKSPEKINFTIKNKPKSPTPKKTLKKYNYPVAPCVKGTNRNPKPDSNGYCPEDKPYYNNIKGCCYKNNIIPKSHTLIPEQHYFTLRRPGEWEDQDLDIEATTEKTKKIEKTEKNIIEIPNKTPAQDKLIGNTIKKLIKEDKIGLDSPNATVTQAIPEIKKELTKTKSFSPAINEKLVSLKAKDTKLSVNNIFGCGLEKIIQNISLTTGNKTRKSQGDPEIPILKNGKEVCAKASSPAAQKILLNNLQLINKIDCRTIIMPMQAQSNCWFNTMFASFLVSDKGRKFFRFWRQLMIEGKFADGTKIKKNMANALLLLNACIEAAYNLNGSYKNIAQAMDTNNVIVRIHKSIPKTNIRKYEAIKDQGFANNPYLYYTDLMKFLGGKEEVNTPKLFKTVIYSDSDDNRKLLTALNAGYTAFSKTIPDVYILEIYDDGSNMDIQRPIEFNVGNLNNYEIYTYKLDSAIIRDTKKLHFCSTLTCNNKEYGFDGASLSRMSEFNWKKLISKNKEWTFKGSVWDNTIIPITWNFRNGYQMLFYYRSK
jgi:hypothetical protein